MKNTIDDIKISKRANIHFYKKYRGGGSGFSSNYFCALSSMITALHNNIIPYFNLTDTWFNPTFDFNTKESKDSTINPWNWWFEQEQLKKGDLIYDMYARDYENISHHPKDFMNQDSMLLFAAASEVYMRPKKFILDQVESIYSDIIEGTKTLGIVARGTEMYFHHPEYPKVHPGKWPDEIKKYLEINDEIDNIFLVTDDPWIMESILNEFPKIKYVDNVFRKKSKKITGYDIDDTKPWWLTPDEPDPNHTRRIGAELLIQTKLLAKCDYFLGSHSGISNMVRFFNRNKFIDSQVI